MTKMHCEHDATQKKSGAAAKGARTWEDAKPERISVWSMNPSRGAAICWPQKESKTPAVRRLLRRAACWFGSDPAIFPVKPMELITYNVLSAYLKSYCHRPGEDARTALRIISQKLPRCTRPFISPSFCALMCVLPPPLANPSIRLFLVVVFVLYCKYS